MDDNCPRWSEIGRAVDEGSLAPALLEHLSQCVACSEGLAGLLLRQEATQAPELRELPHPDAIWWRAEIVGKRKTLQRAGTLIAAAAAAICVMAIVALGALLLWLSPEQSAYVAAAAILSAGVVALGSWLPIAIRTARR